MKQMVVMKIKSKMKASSHLTMPHTKRSGALNLTVKMRKTGKPAEYTRMIWSNSIPSVRPLCVCVCVVCHVCVKYHLAARPLVQDQDIQ